MALNLFGPLTKENIKVSYVDSVLGLINGVSITQANEYARGNLEASRRPTGRGTVGPTTWHLDTTAAPVTGR